MIRKILENPYTGRQREAVLGCGLGDGGRVVVRGDDDIVEVGFRQQGKEKRVWVRHAALVNQLPVCDEPVAPIHGPLPALPAALDQEQCGWTDLRNTSAGQHR